MQGFCVCGKVGWVQPHFPIHPGPLIGIPRCLPQPPAAAAWGAPQSLCWHPESRRMCLRVWRVACRRRCCRPRQPRGRERQPWAAVLGTGLRCRPEQRRERAMLPDHAGGDYLSRPSTSGTWGTLVQLKKMKISVHSAMAPSCPQLRRPLRRGQSQPLRSSQIRLPPHASPLLG